MNTKERVKAALGIVMALAETIRDLGEVPNGHLYAMVMDKLSLEDYNSAIKTLKGTKLVQENGHLLKWVGPKA